MQLINVLLIEDNPLDIKIMEGLVKTISIAEINLFVGTSLFEGKKILREGVIDVVLLDLTLPDSNELNALEEILKDYHDVPIVIITGLDDQEISLLAIQMGAQDYLIKRAGKRERTH